MILTVCLSPKIDVNMEVDNLSVGKTNNIINKKTFFTGNAVNIAIGLAHLNARVFATGFMYEDNGAQFERELHKEGVSYEFVWNKGRVSENYKIVDRRSMLTEISEESSSVSAEKQQELLNLVSKFSAESDCVIVSGALPKGMKADFYNQILSVVPQNVVKIVDAEGERLIQALKCGVKLIKPNLEEFERTLKRKITSKQELMNGCCELIDKGAEYVLLSLGRIKMGAVITDGKKTYHCKSINVAKNSTIGAGGGMVAAATYALLKGGSMQDILRCGIAGGTAAVTSPDSISFAKKKYEDILSSLTVKEI